MSRTRRERASSRKRGNSYQVRVYAGVDPLTGKDRYLTESTTSEREVEKIKTRLLAQVDRQRAASTTASLGHVLDAWLQVHDADAGTLDSYRQRIEKSIEPELGAVPITKITPRMLENLYAKLRRCGSLCDGTPFIEHRTHNPHECRTVRHRRRPGRPKPDDDHDCHASGCQVVECRQHVCRPAAASTIRHVHFIISGALDAAVRWEWLSSNPATPAKKPKQPTPQPSPPTAQEAARIVTAAWEQDDAWGTLVWLAMVTGARRGELIALRWQDVHLEPGVLEIRRAYTHRSRKKVEKDTKTHHIRRVAVDDTTVELLAAHWKRYRAQMEALKSPPDGGAFVFSYGPDHSLPCNPDGISHRYTKMCRSLGITTHLHALRHYSATELIQGGLDVRSVAGRLGHGGGGNTTLRVYAAWVAESDKRAADILTARMPPPPRPASSPDGR